MDSDLFLLQLPDYCHRQFINGHFVCDRGAGQYFILTMGNLSIGEVWALYLSVKEAVQIVNGNFICQQKEAVQIVNGHFICLQKEAVQIVNGHFICMRKKLFILSMGT
jgi:hypothetical protein